MFNNIGDSGLTPEVVIRSTQDFFGCHPAEMVQQSNENPRAFANQLFQMAHFDRAIVMYNRILVERCGNDKIEASYVYANRAAVYLELEFFEHCLRNIKLAEESYPPEKIHKLHQRRQRCEILMKYSEDKAKTINPYGNMFKLSYEANPKLPFFINSIQLKEDSIYGKHLITTRDLKAGDVIAVLDNPLVIRHAGFEGFMCVNCLKNNNFDFHLSYKIDNGKGKKEVKNLSVYFLSIVCIFT